MLSVIQHIIPLVWGLTRSHTCIQGYNINQHDTIGLDRVNYLKKKILHPQGESFMNVSSKTTISLRLGERTFSK